MPISKEDILSELDPLSRRKPKYKNPGSTIDEIEVKTIQADNLSIFDVDDINGDSFSTTYAGTPLIRSKHEMKEVETYSKDKAQPHLHQKNNGGIHSIMNPYSIFTFPKLLNENDFLDTGKNTETDGIFSKYNRELTLERILSDFDPKTSRFGSSKPYYASNFMFNKFHDVIPLNRMITLRRFLSPTYDNLAFPDRRKSAPTDANNPDIYDINYAPIAQAVTYFGGDSKNKLSELFKISGSVAWEEVKASIEDVKGNEQGFDGIPFHDMLSSNQSLFGGIISNFAYGGGDTDGKKQRQSEFQQDFYGADTYFQHTNRTLGPVNVIDQTMTRGRGIAAGIDSIDLSFEFALKSYNNINPRLVMLDIICNMLALSFNNARFWGGMNRYFPNHPQFEFFGDQKAFYEGRYKDYITSVVKKGSTIFGKGFDMVANFFNTIVQAFNSGSGFIGTIKSVASAIAGSNMVKSVGSTIMDLQAAKNRPKTVGFKSLVSGLPVGEWHLTVGNPYQPIMSYGNLICEGFDFAMGDTLGFDDFPTEIEFTIKLKQGRPRDSGDIQSLFNYGMGRMYYPPQGVIDLINSSSGTKSNTKSSTHISNKELAKISKANTIDFNDPDMGQYGLKLIGSVY